jgi:zinc/manganese transport system permease protein
MLASNRHGGEHLKDLLVGQILWVSPGRLPLEALIYAAILAIWFGLGARLGRVGFYALFACAVTFSVQLVGLYLVFASLVLPALATYYASRRRHLKAYAVGLQGYALGLVVSLWLDLPSGAMIVWAMAVVALLVASLERRPQIERQTG